MANRVQKFFQGLLGEKSAQAVDYGDLSFVDFLRSGQLYDVGEYSQQERMRKYLASPWVYACVSKIAQEFAAIELHLYKMDNKGNVNELDTHPALDLIERVNNFMAFYDLAELTATNLELTGNSYWWLVRNAQNAIIEIYPWLTPDRITVVPGKDRFVDRYKYAQPGSGKSIDFDPADIIHFKYMNPSDPYYGASPVQAARMAIETDLKASKWNFRFFKNSARPDGVLQFKDGLSEVQAKRAKEAFREAHGEGQEHQVAVLSKGEYKPTGLAQKDMEFLEQRKFGRDEVLAMFKVPKSVLGITEDVNYASSQAARMVFLDQVIKPKMRKFTTYLNEFLLPNFPDGDMLFFDFVDPTPSDATQTIARYNSGLTYGWLTPNEVRKGEGLPDVEGGDEVFVPASQIPLGSAEEKPPSAGKTMKIKEGQPSVRRFNVHVPSRNERAKRAAMIAALVKDEKIASVVAEKKAILAQPVEVKQEPTEDTDKAFWYKVHAIKMAKQARQEALVRNRLHREFRRQEREVLATVHEKSAEEKAVTAKFDAKKEADIFLSIFDPMMTSILEEAGIDAASLVGTDFNQAEASAHYLADEGLKFCKTVNETTADAIKGVLQAGMENGSSEVDIRKEIQRVFTDASQSRAQAIARTEVSRAANYGAREGYIQSEVVTYLSWLTAGDSDVCEFCLAMDGKETDVKDDFIGKGDTLTGADGSTTTFEYSSVRGGDLHVNCRCTLVPHTEKKLALTEAKLLAMAVEKVNTQVVVATYDQMTGEERLAGVLAEGRQAIDKLKSLHETLESAAKSERDEAIKAAGGTP